MFDHPLTKFADELWIATQRGKFLYVETGSRMAVVRLSGGGLFVYAPIALRGEMRASLETLGPVRAVVAPSLFHHLYVREWMEAFPSASFSACPGLEWKRPDLPFSAVLGDTPEALWAGELEQVYFSARRENEVVFYHPKSRTMLCADSLLNLSTHDALSTRLVARLMGNRAPGVGYLEPFMIRNRGLARRQVDRMLAWDIEKIVLAHGAVIERDGRRLLAQAYAWL
jgi:hypothetical protein